MKKLNELLECSYDTQILDIKSDTRDVLPGDLFVAVKGYNVDHADFIPDAVKRGAVAVVTERAGSYGVPTVVVSDVNKSFYEICSRFYQKNKWDMKMVGITGTDGKTTTATIIWKILEHFSKCAYIGTNGVCFLDKVESSSNTTPLTEFLYRYLEQFHQNQCEYVSLEVSSEALLHGRVDDLSFHYAILTNISEDHLNYHKTIENYVQSKAKLFTLLDQNGYAILNIDDEHFIDVRKKVNAHLVTYGTSHNADFQIKNIQCFEKKTYFDIVHGKETFSITSPYIGIYNAYNVTAAFILCYLEKLDLKKVISVISKLEPIMGRCEFLDFGQKYKIVLDYAHTANGIDNILSTLHSICHQKIITVMGSAGGREKEKRASMGKIALAKSDFVIFTMDDPRWEKVDDIIDDLVSDSDQTNYIRVEDRKDAINQAFEMAEEGDIVAILGKGRDSYMAILDKRVDYCDYDVISEYFNK